MIKQYKPPGRLFRVMRWFANIFCKHRWQYSGTLILPGRHDACKLDQCAKCGKVRQKVFRK